MFCVRQIDRLKWHHEVPLITRACWVWLAVLVSSRTGVASAEMPEIRCAHGLYVEGNLVVYTHTHDDWCGSSTACRTVAAALNKLDGVSDVLCFEDQCNLAASTFAKCQLVAAALNSLAGVSTATIMCLHYTQTAMWVNTTSPDNCTAVAARLTAILQGPTCKHGIPISGPTGGGSCASCDQGWAGSNCDCISQPWPLPPSCPPTCIKDGCVTGDITKKDAKRHCCHSGHETNRCKGTHWRCDPPTTALRGRGFDFTHE
jgi:hypothetical protein